MRSAPQKFTIAIPVKPYVRRFLEFNYGLPISFMGDASANKFFQNLLRKPDKTDDRKYPDILFNHTDIVEITISEHDFYRYGWELTKTNIISFGRDFEDRVKVMMRSIVRVNVGLGIPINKSIEKFQDRFQFDEEIWKYEAIKKDFYRNGQVEIIDFDTEIFKKIEKIILRNLYDLGTISGKVIKEYERA